MDGGHLSYARPAGAVGLWLPQLSRPLIAERFRAVRTETVARSMKMQCDRPSQAATLLKRQDLRNLSRLALAPCGAAKKTPTKRLFADL